MHHITSMSIVALAAVLAMPARPLAAQGNAAGLRDELLQDVNALERKVVALAEAMPPETYAYTPMEGVRTPAQVYLHIAANNYFIPTMLGVAAPSGNSITRDYQSVEAFEAAGGGEGRDRRQAQGLVPASEGRARAAYPRASGPIDRVRAGQPRRAAVEPAIRASGGRQAPSPGLPHRSRHRPEEVRDGPAQRVEPLPVHEVVRPDALALALDDSGTTQNAEVV